MMLAQERDLERSRMLVYTHGLHPNAADAPDLRDYIRLEANLSCRQFRIKAPGRTSFSFRRVNVFMQDIVFHLNQWERGRS